MDLKYHNIKFFVYHLDLLHTPVALFNSYHVHKATPNENIVSRPGFLHFTCGRAPITINHYYEYHYEHNGLFHLLKVHPY